MEKRGKLKVLAVLAACFIISWFAVQKICVRRITNADQVDYQDGFLYGVDVSSQDYCVFRVNIKTSESRYIEIPQRINGTTCTIAYLTPAESGGAYLVKKVKENGQFHQDIVWCDFERKKLNTVIHLEDMPDKQLAGIISVKELVYVYLYNSYGEAEQYFLQDGKLIFSGQTINFLDNTILFDIMEDGSFYEVQLDGKIYQTDKKGNCVCVVDDIGSQDEGWKTNIQLYPDKLYYENTKTGQTYRIETENPSSAPVPCGQTWQMARSFDETRMTAVYRDEGKIKCGELLLEDGRRAAAICGRDELIVDKLEWEKKEVLTVWLLIFLLSSGIIFFIQAVWKMLRRRQAVIPLVLQAAVLAVLLMSAGIGILRNRILFAVQKNVEDNSLAFCVQLGYEYMDMVQLENVQTMCACPQITSDNQLPVYYENTPYFEHNPQDMDEGKPFSQNNEAKIRLYFKKENYIYSIGYSQYAHNLPLQYNYAPCSCDILSAMEKVFEQKQIAVQKYNDLDGWQYAVFIPFADSGGEYPLLLEVMVTLGENNQIFADEALMIESLLYWVSGILLGTIVFLIWLNMKSLGELKQAALKVSEGKLGTLAQVSGRSEAAATAVRFNHMSRQIFQQISGIQQYQEKYSALAPLKLLDGSKDGSKQGRYPMMTVGFWNEEEIPSQVKNLQINRQIEQLHRYGGEIISFASEGLNVLFLTDVSDALSAAVNILQDRQQGKAYRTAIAVSVEEIHLGVTGSRLRSEVSAFGINGNFTEFLKHCAEKYKASLFLTGTALECIPGFLSLYHCRLIGYFLLSCSQKTEKIYEVLDGEPKEERRKKMLTREAFSKGVDLFCQQKFMEARMAFIRVIAEHPQDGAALSYIRLCEKNDSVQKDEQQLYLEIY